MTQRLVAELVDDQGGVRARAHASIWTRRTQGGLMDWGGSLDPAESLPPIEPGAYVLRFADGREANIIVNSVRVSTRLGHGVTCSVTFVGNGDLPSQAVPTH